MRLLLDENLPKKLKMDFPEHEIFTVSDMKWTGKKNGELLQLMLADNFNALLTFDKNLQYQQNFKKYSLPVIVLLASDNTYITLSRLVVQIKELLDGKLLAGPNIVTHSS